MKNAEIKKNGYSMNEGKRVIMNAPATIMILSTEDPDYCAMMELHRQLASRIHDSMTLMSMSFSLGRAIGIRDERARRNGIKLCKPTDTEIENAKRAVKTAELRGYLSEMDNDTFEAFAAHVRALANGASNDEAVEIGNKVLAAHGKAQLFSTEYAENAI